MVIPAVAVWMLQAPLLAAAAAPVEKLPPPTRAALFMAIVGIALVGMFFIVAILLGGHWVRRQGNYRRGPSVPPDRSPIELTKGKAEEDNDEDVPAQPQS